MNQTKNQKVGFNTLDQKEIQGIKAVKNSHVFSKNGYVYAVHYGKVIFQHNEETKDTIIDLNCSMTSNRLIHRCLNYYGLTLDQCVNIHEGAKWNYSGEVQN